MQFQLYIKILSFITEVYLILTFFQTLHMQSHKSTQNNSIEGARKLEIDLEYR